MSVRSALMVRWSLRAAREGVEQELRDYVQHSSHPRFETMAGLRFKTWRLRPGEWFEGCYVFVDDATRAAFEEEFSAAANGSPVSVMLGSGPVLVEACEVVAVAQGPDGFVSAPSYDH